MFEAVKYGAINTVAAVSCSRKYQRNYFVKMGNMVINL
jgi:hypothetical protein